MKICVKDCAINLKKDNLYEIASLKKLVEEILDNLSVWKQCRLRRLHKRNLNDTMGPKS